ncbi:MAG: MBL fold metallo-hydrolase [archaeon]|nr:MBL fold metallo-hydrolase [Nanoarchaeota archaeon]
MIKVTVLHTELTEFENSTSGFSLLVETENRKILFDVSYSDEIIKNSIKGGINLDNIDYLILSHGHVDHSQGIKHIEFSKVKNLLAHPTCFKKRYFEGEGQIGIPLELSDLKLKTNVIMTKEPYWIEKEHIVFLGQIPRENNFEGKEIIGNLENGENDIVLDDSAIVIKGTSGLVIISGCSHSGICNIIEYSKQIFNENRISTVMGGFHLFNPIIIDKTLKYFRTQNIKNIFFIHCFSEYALSKFQDVGAKRVHTLQRLII